MDNLDWANIALSITKTLRCIPLSQEYEALFVISEILKEWFSSSSYVLAETEIQENIQLFQGWLSDVFRKEIPRLNDAVAILKIELIRRKISKLSMRCFYVESLLKESEENSEIQRKELEDMANQLQTEAMLIPYQEYSKELQDFIKQIKSSNVMVFGLSSISL